MIILSLLRCVGFLAFPVFFLYKYLLVNYPDETQRIIHQSSWAVLKLETQLNITLNQTRLWFNEVALIPLYHLIYPTCEEKCIIFIKDGTEIKTMTRGDVILSSENPEYDFIFYKKNNTFERFDTIEKIKEIKTDVEYISQPSSVRFLSAEVYIVATNTDSKFKILLNKSDFYVVGNVLFDKQFIHWYLSKHYNVDINTLENMHYTICIIDSNVSITTITSDNKIILLKDTYEIQ